MDLYNISKLSISSSSMQTLAMILQIIIAVLIFGVNVVENAAPRHPEATEKVQSLNQTHASAARSCTFRPELRIDCYPETGSNQGAHLR